MKHTSIKLDTPCEFINVTPVNPLISKCQIKVCYVGEEPNRNRSVITKETAIQMANSLPGSPIVGFFDKSTGDFEEHSREIEVSNGEFKIKDITRPYGFVDLNAKPFFQKFLDDNKNEHEYLMVDGYLWTGQYPEAQRIIEHGNNQSMELDDKTIDAYWSKDSNGKPEFFIINEAIISKLCILGEDFEPCFEGSTISKVQFSFEDEFKQQVFSMINELKELLTKGGTQVFTTYAVSVGDSLWNSLYSFAEEKEMSIEAALTDGERNFAVLKDAEGKVFSLDFSLGENEEISLAEEVKPMEDYTPAEEPQFALEDVEAFISERNEEFKKSKEEDKEDKSEESESEEKSEGEEKPEESEEKEESDDEEEEKDEDKKKKKFSLEEIPEYVELLSKFSALEADFNAIVAEKEQLASQVESLTEFKKVTERRQKEDMIKNTFYMLSDEDKADVVANIDAYSLTQIEEKLSVICVRNKVDFSALDDDKDVKDPTTYNFSGTNFSNEDDSVMPSWVSAVLAVEKTLK